MGRVSAAPATGFDRAIDRMGIAIFLSLFMLSPFGLALLKWDYVSAGGAAFMRFHPSTYLILLTFLLVLITRGNPILAGVRIIQNDARIGLYLVAWALLSFQIIVVQKHVIGIAVDTYLMPILVVIIYDRLSGEMRVKLAYLVHAALITNAALGLGEFLSGFRLTPMVIPGLAEDVDYRSSALLGHPLSNALMMGAYGVMLLSGAGRILPESIRNLAFVLTHFSMVAFGGRTALVLLLLADFIALGLGTIRLLAGGRVKLGYLAAAGLMLPAFPVLVGVLEQAGFFDKLIQRFTSDGGSARARLVMLEMGEKLSWTDFLFGPQRDYVQFLMTAYGIEFGIESTWVAFVYYFGLLVSVLFWIGLVILTFIVMSRCRPGAWFPVIFFFVINSTFLGIAGRTYALTLFFMILLVLMPRQPSGYRPAASPQPYMVPPGGALRC